MLTILSIFQLSHLLQVYFHGNNIAMSKEAILEAIKLIEYGEWYKFIKGCDNYILEAEKERVRIQKMNVRKFAKLFDIGEKDLKSILRDPRPYKAHYINTTVERKLQIANNMLFLIDSLPEVVVKRMEPDQEEEGKIIQIQPDEGKSDRPN